MFAPHVVVKKIKEHMPIKFIPSLDFEMFGKQWVVRNTCGLYIEAEFVKLFAPNCKNSQKYLDIAVH